MDIFAELEKLRREHLVVGGDCWYSCPKSDDCCNELPEDMCTCGADADNALLDAIIAELHDYKLVADACGLALFE